MDSLPAQILSLANLESFQLSDIIEEANEELPTYMACLAAGATSSKKEDSLSM